MILSNNFLIQLMNRIKNILKYFWTSERKIWSAKIGKASKIKFFCIKLWKSHQNSSSTFNSGVKWEKKRSKKISLNFEIGKSFDFSLVCIFFPLLSFATSSCVWMKLETWTTLKWKWKCGGGWWSFYVVRLWQ